MSVLRILWKIDFQVTSGSQVINQTSMLLADHHHKIGRPLIKKCTRVFVF